MDAFGTYDMAGNMREWLVNPMEGGRLTLGAAWPEAEFEVGWRIAKPEFDRSPTLGVRLMQHIESGTSMAHATGKVEVTTERDYRHAKPVGETEYQVFRRLYAYDPAPLNGAVQDSGSAAHYDWQKVTFDAAYGGERAGAYLFLPKGRTGPYQSVVVWLGSGAMTEKVLVPENVAARGLFLVRSGRVMVIPLFKGSFERDDETFSTTISVPDRSIYFRDLAIQWIKDLGRTVDYLQSRNDLDSGRIGFLGISWGGQIAPIALAVEPRIKAAVLDIGGLWVYGPGPLPEVDPLNFLPRVTTPLIMLNGEYDVVFPLEVAQKPFYRLLGTPAKDKKHVVFPAGHYVPQDSLISRALNWYDRYLGVPEARR